MSKPEQRPPSQSGAFPASDLLRLPATPPRLEDLTLQQVNEIRLLLHGESVIDWYRLDLTGAEDALRLLRLSGFDYNDPTDRERLDSLRDESVRYIVETLGLKVPKHVAESSVVDIELLASSDARYQRSSCLVLKVMHIMHHLDARELRTLLAISDNELFTLVEEGVVRMFDDLRGAGVPVVEFSWSRKTRDSLITKMMVKRSTSAARVFDRLRFRVIVARPEDLETTLHVLLQRCIPYNYVVPGQTVNTLVDPARLDALGVGSPRVVAEPICQEEGEEDLVNEFSGADFQIVNFIADLPIRVDDLVWKLDDTAPTGRGRVVFVLAEFQIMDGVTAARNQSGESSHVAYKQRQHARVKERLLRAPSDSGRSGPADDPAST